MFFTAFIFGLLGASLALVVEIVVLNFGGTISYVSLPLNFSSLPLLVAVALIEEGGRYLLLRQFVVTIISDTVSSWWQTLLIGLFFGIGFASLELSFLYAQESFALIAILGIILVHLTLSVLFALALTKKLFLPPLWALAVGSLLHFLYNITHVVLS